MLLIIFFYHFLRFIYVICQQLYLAIFFQHFGSTKAHACHIDINGTLHPASAGLLHSLPVLKRIADQQVRRNGRNRIIEITHLHGIQRYFYHCTVRTIFRHGDPVAHLQHIVGRKLNTGYKSHDTIFENQHQNSGRRSQSGQQDHRALIDQNAYNNDGSYKEKNHLRRLQKSFQRFVPILLPLTVDLIDSRKQSADETKKNSNDIYQTETPQKIEQIRIRMLGECDRNGDINQDRRYHPADIHHHFMVEYNVVPGSFGLLHQLGYHP